MRATDIDADSGGSVRARLVASPGRASVSGSFVRQASRLILIAVLVAAAPPTGQPGTFYFGGDAGGAWKTTNFGPNTERGVFRTVDG